MTLDGHLKTGLMFALVAMAQPISLIPDEFKIVFALAIFIGNVAPDFLEMGIIPHRTYTHYPVLWLTLLGMSYAGISVNYFGEIVPAQVCWALAGLSIGSLWHIVCDWPYYGGVPVFWPTSKIPLFGWEFEGPMNRIFEHSMILLGFMLILWDELGALVDYTPITSF